MDRFNTLNGAVGAPTAPAAPTNKYFTEGNPGGGIPATTPGPWWFHMQTEELRNLLVAAGITPDHTNLTQVASAVQALVAAGGTRSKLLQLSSSVAANALTVGLAATSLDFRSGTLTSGAITTVNVGALSIVVPSGATLGAISGQQAQFILLVAYNAGTPVLCIVNAIAAGTLDEAGTVSPVTISAAATSAQQVYSASAVAAGSPYRVVGYVNVTEATAGVYATAASLVQGAGGQALGALQSLGFGQSWQTVTRTSGTTYYNTTGRPIMLASTVVTNSTQVAVVTASINGGTAFPYIKAGNSTSGAVGGSGSIVIPIGASYVITETGTAGSPSTHQELR